MNREIKFRAWEIDWHNKNLKQNQGRMIQWPDIQDELSQLLKQTTRFTLMQFTGLHDKNGKEIYEGDIVAFGELEAVVEWDEKRCSFITKKLRNHEGGWDMGESQSEHLFGIDIFEVIGNIYENSGLIDPSCKSGNAPHDFQIEDFSPAQAYEKCVNCGKRKN